MKKIYFLFALLLIPTLISAKTVTCTSDSHFIIGQSVYNNTNVECSEGTVELFAVGKIYYLENDYLAKEGESYYLDFLWTGEFNAGDTLLVDGDNQSDLALGCDTGCHLISKSVEAEEGPDTGTGPEKEIAVGTIYYIGDRIKFNDLLIILFADSDDAFAEIKKGSYTLPTPEYTEFAGNWLWIFDGFMREYGESTLVELRFGYTLDITADKAPIGVKCTGGDGTMNAPFTFEPVYATDNNQTPSISPVVGTTYYVGDTINFSDKFWINNEYIDSSTYKKRIRAGSYTVPSPHFAEFSEILWWEFNDFLIEYDALDEQYGSIGDPETGIYFGSKTGDISESNVPVGFKCTGGTGTSSNPFTFEIVYASNNNQTTDEPGVEYTILEGANQTYVKGSNGTITIKASGPLNKLIAIEIDNGNVINASNYDLAEGSTIVTFKTSFLENSSLGEHTITLKYDDGEVETKLTIANASDDNQTTGGDNNQGTGTTEPTGNTTNNPETGDKIVLYVVLLGIGIMGLVGTGLYLRERKFN